MTLKYFLIGVTKWSYMIGIFVSMSELRGFENYCGIWLWSRLETFLGIFRNWSIRQVTQQCRLDFLILPKDLYHIRVTNLINIEQSQDYEILKVGSRSFLNESISHPFYPMFNGRASKFKLTTKLQTFPSQFNEKKTFRFPLNRRKKSPRKKLV